MTDIRTLYEATFSGDVVKVVDHVWSGKTVFAIVIRQDGRITTIPTEALRVYDPAHEEPSAQQAWSIGDEMDTFWWTDRSPNTIE